MVSEIELHRAGSQKDRRNSQADFPIFGRINPFANGLIFVSLADGKINPFVSHASTTEK